MTMGEDRHDMAVRVAQAWVIRRARQLAAARARSASTKTVLVWADLVKEAVHELKRATQQRGLSRRAAKKAGR